MKYKKPDMVLLFLIFLLLAVGLIMVFSSSTGIALAITRKDPNPYYFLERQIVWVILGFAGLLAAYHLDLNLIKKYIPWLYMTCIGMLLLVLVPGIGMDVSGARRWFHFSFVNLQPAEFSKVVLILFISWFITRKGGLSTSLWKTIFPLLVSILPLIYLVYKEPDFGTAFLMFTTALGTIFVSGIQLKDMALLSSASLPAGIFYMLKAKYRLKRLQGFFNPWKHPYTSGYHIIQSLIAVGSGGWFGVGLGDSRQKFFYLPDQHTDYIFAILGEEGGILATLFVLLLFLFVAARGLNIALKQTDPFKRILAAGLTISIVSQALINMAMVIHLLPPVGIPLPFLSYGGSSLMTCLIMIGLLLNLSRIPIHKKIEMTTSLESA